MTYTLGIPDANQSPATQQAPLQTNTNLVDQYFGVDHVRYTAATDQGEHLKVTLTDVQPDPVLLAPKSQLYSKAVSGPTDQQLFFANQAGVQQLSGNAILPIKAWARVLISSTGTFNVTSIPSSFNVKQVITSQPSLPAPFNTATYQADSGEFYIVEMQNPLPSANYAVVATVQSKNPLTAGQTNEAYGLVYDIVNNQIFKLSFRASVANVNLQKRPFWVAGLSFIVVGG